MEDRYGHEPQRSRCSDARPITPSTPGKELTHASARSLAGVDAIAEATASPAMAPTARAGPPYIPPLAGNPVVLDGDPSSLINLVLNGAEPLVVKGTPDA